jgi:hypothetical protein
MPLDLIGGGSLDLLGGGVLELFSDPPTPPPSGGASAISKDDFLVIENEGVVWNDATGDVQTMSTPPPSAVTSRASGGGGAGSGTRSVGVVQTVETNVAILQEAAFTGLWSGNFYPNDWVIATDLGVSRSPRQLTVTLDSPVVACGFQLQSVIFGAFTGTAIFKDTGGGTLLTLTLPGNSNPANDGSAVFFGAQSDDGTPIIKSVVITCTNDSSGFGINRFGLVVPAAVPPPPVIRRQVFECAPAPFCGPDDAEAELAWIGVMLAGRRAPLRPRGHVIGRPGRLAPPSRSSG